MCPFNLGHRHLSISFLLTALHPCWWFSIPQAVAPTQGLCTCCPHLLDCSSSPLILTRWVSAQHLLPCKVLFDPHPHTRLELVEVLGDSFNSCPLPSPHPDPHRSGPRPPLHPWYPLEMDMDNFKSLNLFELLLLHG